MLYIIQGVKKSQRWLSDWTPTILKKKMELKDFILLYHSHTEPCCQFTMKIYFLTFTWSLYSAAWLHTEQVHADGISLSHHLFLINSLWQLGLPTELTRNMKESKRQSLHLLVFLFCNHRKHHPVPENLINIGPPLKE